MTLVGLGTPEPESAADQQTPVPGARLPYVLIAESDVSRAARCVEAVRDFRLGALVARDGAEASHIFDVIGPPALLIVDLSLPGRDSLHLLETIRQRDAEVPMLALAPCEEIRSAAMERYPRIRIGRAALAAAGVGEIREAIGFLLHGSSATTAAAHERQPTLRELVEDARRMTGAAGAAAYLRTVAGDEMHAHVVWVGRVDGEAPYCEPRIFDWIRQSGQPIIMPDLGGQPVLPQMDDRSDSVIRGLVAVPIVGSAHDVIGVLCAFDVKPLVVDVDNLNAFKLLGYEAARSPELGARPLVD
jgi:CheY-like chemotaxis protein